MLVCLFAFTLESGLPPQGFLKIMLELLRWSLFSSPAANKRTQANYTIPTRSIIATISIYTKVSDIITQQVTRVTLAPIDLAVAG